MNAPRFSYSFQPVARVNPTGTGMETPRRRRPTGINLRPLKLRPASVARMPFNPIYVDRELGFTGTNPNFGVEILVGLWTCPLFPHLRAGQDHYVNKY